jgi:hypothetical protein
LFWLDHPADQKVFLLVHGLDRSPLGQQQFFGFQRVPGFSTLCFRTPFFSSSHAWVNTNKKMCWAQFNFQLVSVKFETALCGEVRFIYTRSWKCLKSFRKPFSNPTLAPNAEILHGLGQDGSPCRIDQG